MKTEIYKHIEVLVNRYPVLNSVKDEIVEAYFLLVESYKNEGKLLIAGKRWISCGCRTYCWRVDERF